MQDRLELPGFAVGGVLDPELVLLGGDSHSLVSGVEAHVLHADDFLALMLADGVPDGHVVGGQVQLVGAGQGVVLGERGREGRDRLVQQMKDRALHRPPQRLRQGLDLLPGRAWKRTRRSLTYSPGLSEILAGEHGRFIAHGTGP